MMKICESGETLKPAVVVIFGSSGDLAHRKLIPALYRLYANGAVDERFAVIGMDRSDVSTDKFRENFAESTSKFLTSVKVERSRWERFAANLHHMKADFDVPKTYRDLEKQLTEYDRKWKTNAAHVFYLAVPPALFPMISSRLGESPLGHDDPCLRIVVEKPFGHNLASARELNETLTRNFDEPQIYRIDHYLGKETVQNLLALRFANTLFEPLWDRRYIEQVQITIGEQMGVEHRGGYYEKAGALRDMVQSHMLQILCLIAMEPPVYYEDEEIRNKKVDVVHALRPISKDEVPRFAARGQYGRGVISGRKVCGYREEPGVSTVSNTETFAALKLYVDNWRWQDVPFYLRTGKRLPSKVAEAVIQFRSVPHRSFPMSSAEGWEPNRLVCRIQPEEGISLRFQVKKPGSQMDLGLTDLQFSYRQAFQTPSPEAYETLLIDAIRGDSTLFMRADQVEAAWEIIDPIVERWANEPPHDFPNYASGTPGPASSGELIAQDEYHWFPPSMPSDRECWQGGRKASRA
jgi:glucose-6-phosphate 1-dehydrogenase